MSFGKYENYKDKDIKWLSNIPNHWNVEPCRGLLTERNERNNPIVNENYLSLMANIGIILYADKGDVGNKKPEDLSKCKQIYVGDLVINSMNYGIGSYGLSKHRGVCSPVYIVLKPKLEKIEERFAFRILEVKKLQQYAQSFGNGILEHRASISWDILKKIWLPVPPIEEQKQILKFLDIEAAKIDDLVSEQEGLIELLKEKRQALISHAVTKGINSSVKMKDSGVTWLGKIPEHWNVSQSRRLFKERKQKAITGERQLTASQKHGVIYQDEFMEIEGISVVQVIHGADILKHVEPNDFVISMRSFQGGIEWCGSSGSISSAYVMLIPEKKVYSSFFKHLFKSNSYIQALQSTTNLVRDGQALRFSNFSLIDLPELPIDEQKLIAEYLDEKLIEFDSLMERAIKCISLLQERRASLISNAVTGQIDVRNYQTKEVA